MTPDPLTVALLRAGCVAMLVAAIAGTLRISPPDATTLGAAAGCAFAGVWELARRLAHSARRATPTCAPSTAPTPSGRTRARSR